MSNIFITTFLTALTWAKKESVVLETKLEDSSTVETLKADGETLWSEFLPVAEASLKSAVGIVGTAILDFLEANPKASVGLVIDAGVTAAEAAFVAAGHTISTQGLTLLSTTVVNSVASHPVAAAQ